jgi:hypothetical protein
MTRAAVSAFSHSRLTLFVPVLVHLTTVRLRSFVHIIHLIRLFFMFFPNRLGRFDSPFLLHKLRRVWNFTIFRLRDFFPFLPVHPFAANPTIDCLLHCFCQSNLLAFFSPAADGITLSFLSPLSVCYRFD